MKVLRLTVILAGVILLGTAISVQAQDDQRPTKPPPAPEGFKWHKIDRINGAVLVPDDWHYSLDTTKGAHAYFVTQEEATESRSFKVGMSMNVVRDIEAKANVPASEYARLYSAKVIEDNNERSIFSDSIETGNFKGYVTRSVMAREESDSIVHQRVCLGNTETETLYLIEFVAPQPDWPMAWTKGQKIMQTIILDQRY
jgi:hypothetical protein